MTRARTIELPLTKAKAIVSELTKSLGIGLDEVKLPVLVVKKYTAASAAATVMEIVGARLAAMKASLKP